MLTDITNPAAGVFGDINHGCAVCSDRIEVLSGDEGAGSSWRRGSGRRCDEKANGANVVNVNGRCPHRSCWLLGQNSEGDTANEQDVNTPQDTDQDIDTGFVHREHRPQPWGGVHHPLQVCEPDSETWLLSENNPSRAGPPADGPSAPRRGSAKPPEADTPETPWCETPPEFAPCALDHPSDLVGAPR
ncbi:hypothetical protein BO78DRAFT_424579 [Aspergillus sclerotiicarbonarius CBS 121057]|uniref:Uncharacterized protein n=1 Tax=Aspergillus sclerotiicarbonarius (strain CBS 121057 / IBT 28362) TaxID=1448318 RepID=A0A319F5C1_ASPSB|nr:hypothetical protein BO78DRAFT_424579 [Aspergillus sclerotiicarbonarius CBS 121057]